MKNKKNTKLAKKIIPIIILMIMIPVGIVGAISIEKSKNVLKQNLNITSSQTLNEVEKGFSEYMDVLTNQITMLTYNEDIKDLLSLENANPEDTHEDVITYVQSAFNSIKQTSPEVLNVYFAGENGEIVLDSGVKTIDEVNYKEKPWYIKAKEANGKAVYIEPFTEDITGKSVFAITQSVKGYNGEFIGVISIDIAVSNLEDYIKDIGLLKTGYVLLSDKDGNIIVNNDKNNIINNNLNELTIWKNISSEENGTYEYNNAEKTIYVTQQTNQKTGWKLIGLIDNEEILQHMRVIKNTIFITILICIVLGSLISILLINILIKKIKNLNVSIGKVAGGDFTERIEVTVKDEIGELGINFNFMLDTVCSLIKDVKDTSSNLLEAAVNISNMSLETTSSVSEVSSAIGEVSNGATNQAHDTQNISESVEKLDEKLSEVDKQTNNISDLSNKAENLSSQGLEILNTLVDKSRKTNENSIKSTNIVNEMTESIESINYISNAIAGITEQTNLLALNASIEAARAGEAGKGFAVVADEIRALAEESKNSTDQIKSIINEINNKAISASGAMLESTKTLKEQDESVEETKNIFNNIVHSIINLTDGIKHIKNLNEEMNKDKDAVKSQVESISAISEETASISEEVSASTEEVNITMDKLTQYANSLKDIANELKSKINKFTLS